MDAACGLPSSFRSLILVWWNSKELVLREYISSACMRIPNRHFPTWKIKVLILPPVSFPTAPHLFPKSRARTTHQTPWIDHANGLEISCSVLYDGVCNAWPPAHETTHPCPSTPWRFRSQVFSCLGASPLPGHERFLLWIYSCSVLKFVLSVNTHLNPTCLGLGIPIRYFSILQTANFFLFFWQRA